MRLECLELPNNQMTSVNFGNLQLTENTIAEFCVLQNLGRSKQSNLLNKACK